MDNILERIEREAGVTNLVEILVERLQPTDLQSLMLEVYRQRAAQRSPVDVLTDYTNNRFVRPSSISPVQLAAWENTFWSLLPEIFTPIALSPVCPLGTNSVVATVDQNNSVSTSRNTEVLSDCTNVLALEAAIRRRQLLKVTPRSSESVHLAASHRLLRPQKSANPGHTAHFQLMGMCSAGRDTGNLQFELSSLRLHTGIYVAALRAFLDESVALQLYLSDFATEPRFERLDPEVLAPIRDTFKNVECGFDRERITGRGYYQQLCFHIYATAPSGQSLQLADGGIVDWTQKYLSSRKERLFISGIGSERVCQW